ncbi:MAG TPA: hypothetical protein VMV47_10345 [Bacteroidales bacterium]|nr:hypothetical protein [Bacteroidales bacterium]
MKYTLVTICAIFLLNTQYSSAQYYETGQDPASLKWLQIKTDRFRVIYPETYGNEGIRFAKALDDSYFKLEKIFPEKKFRIPVIIHNYSTESNGYVAWAPKRMEVYPTPDQNSIPLDTRTQLAIHELTHVFQLVSLNQGFSKAMSFILGEQFAGITSVMMPLWYFEGNAVFAESALTESGRGRSPSFLKEFKAIALENDKLYKYDRIVNDSYKRYIPNHYQSGYQMVIYSLAKEGPQFWNKTLDYTARNPYLFDPVNLALLKNAGLTKRKLYSETFDTLKALWNKELSEKNIIIYDAVNPEKKGEFVNYNSPVQVGKDSIIAIKTSMGYPSSFVLINPSIRSEKRIHIPGQVYPFTLTSGGGKITWVENKPDPRWDNRTFSVIKIMDIKTGKTKSLSDKSRYLSVAISPDGKTIAATENSIDNQNSLLLIGSDSGEIIRSVKTPGNGAIQQPRWDSSEDKITVISLTENGEGILSYSVSNRTWETLKDHGREDLQASILRNDSLFYVSSAGGTENVYLKLSEGKTNCITNSKYGINDISLSGNLLLFSNYTASGYNISMTGINDYPGNSDRKTDTSSFLINRFPKHNEASGLEDLSAYAPQPYKKYQHLFRFHSWMPFYADIEEVKSDPASVRPGVTLMSQNQLSTLIATVGYEYNESKEHILHSGITWKGWYPVIESKIDYGGNPGVQTGGDPVSTPDELKKGLRWRSSIYLPLRYASGKFLQYLQPSIIYDYWNSYVYLKDEGKFDYGQELVSARLFISNYHRSSIRDIYPRWAQTIDFNYTFSPFSNSIYPDAISIKTSFYTPGILPNNGIKFRYEREKQGEAIYSLGNKISFPRGYRNIISKDLSFMSADYSFPVAYPDFNIWSLVYLKRIRCTLFGDYATGTNNFYLKENGSGLALDYTHNFAETFSSFGFELIADFHVLRLPFMISGGVQTAWKDISEKPFMKVLFNIELFGMAINKGKYPESNLY